MLNQNTLQFYPTPKHLALKAWALFENKTISRLLEPSAGDGDLINALRAHEKSLTIEAKVATKRDGTSLPDLPRYDSLDVIEINPEHHERLRRMDATVVGYDFLSHTNGAMYSHIIMNPPFINGSKHVNHAWDILFNGEIVAIINANTLKNADSFNDRRLVELIAEHGSVSFYEDAFTSDDTKRKTNVEIALIHLKKEARNATDLLAFTEGLARATQRTAKKEENVIGGESEIALSDSFIENTVINYQLAVNAATQAHIATQVAARYEARLGFCRTNGHGGMQSTEDVDPNAIDVASVVSAFMSESHARLRHSAWQRIINSSYTTHHLTAQTRNEVQNEFSRIAELEFNTANVYGFLHGLVSQSGKIQEDMMLEVFDDITRYHHGNHDYYLGWKSNDKHRTAGKSVKMTRFILPADSITNTSFISTGGYRDIERLKDVERLFNRLAGVRESEVSLAGLLEDRDTFRALVNGERLSSDYFDIRYYAKRGSIHFFPKRKDLIRRLNVMVGRARQWLPESVEQASDVFMAQFDHADNVMKHLDKKAESYEAKYDEQLLCDYIEQAQRDAGITPCLEGDARYRSALLSQAAA